MNQYWFLLFFISAISSKLVPPTQLCGLVDRVSDTATCRPVLPKPVLRRVDNSVGTVLDKIIEANVFDTMLSLEIEATLRRASEQTFLKEICIQCLKMHIIDNPDFLYSSMHNWLKGLTITSYPIFFQSFNRWINNKPYLRTLSEGKNELKEALLAKLDEIPFCFKPSLTIDDIKIQIFVHNSKNDKFNTLKNTWGKANWHNSVCSIYDGRMFNNLLTPVLLDYLKGKCA